MGTELNEFATFVTARLRIQDARLLAQNDRETLLRSALAILSSEVVADLPPSWQQIDSLTRAESWLAELLAASELRVIAEAASGEPIGFMVLHRADPAYHVWHLGYVLGQPHWGKGYATELLGGLVSNLKSSEPLTHFNTSLLAGVEEENVASIKVLEKCGFHRLDKQRQGSTLFYEFIL